MHIPVLLSNVLSAINPKPYHTYFDGTFGGGGHTRAILEAEPLCLVDALDQDPLAKERAVDLERDFAHRFRFFQGRFSQISELLKNDDESKYSGALFDFGVSSFQLDTPERGFSFRYDGPLDMRMNPMQGTPAKDIINNFSKEELISIFQYYGEQPYASAIAQSIIEYRKKNPIQSTLELASIVRGVIKKTKKIDPATLVFQSLRIFVNDELKEIELALEACEKLLIVDGILVVITFHGLEERVIKKFINDQKKTKKIHRMVFEKKLILPDFYEKKNNPRARCAKLRIIKKVNAHDF
jgi:16S rRNA (cytosine1402-N4)-methyltransferase